MIYKNTPPEHWSKRQIILILEQDEIDMLYDDLNGRDLLQNSELCILTKPLDESNIIVRELVNNNLDKDGILLVQSPFNVNGYDELVNISTYPIEKYFIFSQLCNLLGARNVKIEEIEIRKNNVSHKGDVKVDVINILDGHGEWKKEQIDDTLKKININLTFSGGEPDIERAHDLIKLKRLSKRCPEMVSLIEMRHGNNLLKSSEVILNLSQETNSIFKALAELEIPKFLSKAKTNIEQISTTKCEYVLKVIVEF